MALVLSRLDGTTQRWRISPNSERVARPEIGEIRDGAVSAAETCFGSAGGVE
jgi:hypothetical protein